MRVLWMIQGLSPRRAVVGGAVALALSWGAWLGQPVAAAAADRFQVQVSAGYDGYAKSDDWTPIRVSVKNNGDDFNGVLQVDDASRSAAGASNAFSTVQFGGPVLGAPVGFATHQVSVFIPAGGTRHYTLYVAGAQRPRATLLAGGNALAAAEPAQPLTFTGPTALLVAVVSDQADTLDQLALARPSSSTTIHVVHFKPADLPSSGVLLRSLDAVVFDDASTDALTTDQRAAVRDYVQDGGGLLLVGGPGAAKTLAGIPAELRPVKLASTVVNDLHVVAGLASSAAPAGGAEVSTGQLEASAHAVRDGQVPMVAWLSHGTGVVVYTAFDAGAEPMASWPGEKTILRQLVDRATGTSSGTVQNAKGVGSALASGTRAGATLDYGAVSNVLNNLPSLDVPQLGLVGWLLFGYAIVVGPVNYLLLKRMRRRHLAWLTIPAVVAVSSSAVLLIGLTVKGVGTQVNQVRVVEMSPGSSRTYTVTYSGLVAAHRGDYTIALPGAAFAGGAPSYNSSSTDRLSITGDPPTALLQGVTAYSIRTVAAEGFGDGQGHLDASLHLVGSTASGSTAGGATVAGTVVNNTGTDLEDAVVVYRGQFQLIGILRAGQAQPISFRAGSGNQFGGDVASAVYPNTNGGNGGTATDRQQQRRAQILRSLVGAGFGAPTQTGPPMLVGFSPQALSAPIVDGRPIKAQGEAVVVMSIPLSADATLANLPVGDAAATLVDTEGDIQTQGFNAPNTPIIRVAGGSATYEFDLPGTGWRSGEVLAGSVGISSCNALPIPVPAPLPPGVGGGSSSGSAAPVPSTCVQPGLSAFNFRSAQWVPLKPGASATRFAVDLAGGLISADGVVLVRYTAPAGAASNITPPEITAVRGATT